MLRTSRDLDDAVAREQIEHPDDSPARVEARVRQRLQRCKAALAAARREMIETEERDRARRDKAIRAYVGSSPTAEAVHAA